MRARRDLVAILALVLGVLLVASGCAEDSSSGGEGGKVDVADSEFTDETGTDEVDVAVPDNTFDPAYLMISPGTTVTWTNEGRNDHNVVAVEKGSFEGVDTDQFGPGKVHSATFDAAGDYPYYCSIHGTKNLNGQSGVIRVVEDSAPA